jgi:hypothetical protein
MRVQSWLLLSDQDSRHKKYLLLHTQKLLDVNLYCWNVKTLLYHDKSLVNWPLSVASPM